MRITRSALGWALLIACLVGCSGGAEGGKRVPVYKVTGKVTMNGGPLIGAIISFAPTEGQPVAVGRSDDAGMYSLTTYDPGDGAAKGKFNITVMKIMASAPAATVDTSHGPNYKPSAHGAAAAKSASDSGNLVPPQYADSAKTPLNYTVEEKDNNYNIEIK